MAFDTVVDDLEVNSFSPWSSSKLLKWDTITTDTTVKDGDKIVVDTSLTPVTLTLPLGNFTQIQVKRIGVNLLTVETNGHIIDGSTDDRLYETNGDFGTYLQSGGNTYELRSNGKVVFIQDIIDVLQITNPFNANTTAQQVLDWLGAITAAEFTLVASSDPYTPMYDGTDSTVSFVVATDDVMFLDTTGLSTILTDTLTLTYVTEGFDVELDAVTSLATITSI